MDGFPPRSLGFVSGRKNLKSQSPLRKRAEQAERSLFLLWVVAIPRWARGKFGDFAHRSVRATREPIEWTDQKDRLKEVLFTFCYFCLPGGII